MSLDPFRRLIEANRMDQRITRYRSFGDLVDYCMFSAAQVGRLVLAVFGVSTSSGSRRRTRSASPCSSSSTFKTSERTARRGRIYLPTEDMERFGCTEAELLGSGSSPALRRLVAMEVLRARDLLEMGVQLAGSLRLRPRAAVAGFVAGGTAALDSIERSGYDVLGNRCRPRKLRFARRVLATLVAASKRPGGS